MAYPQYAHNAEFKGSLTLFGADIIHKIIGLDSNTVSKWRNRHFFTSGELVGRGYVYTIEEITKLLLLKEMSDVGVKMITAATAADTASMDATAHALLRAPLIDAWGSPSTDMQALAETIRIHPDPLPSLFNAETDFQEPWNFLITGGDDFDDWELIDSLDDIDALEDFNLVRILVDLRDLADRVIAVIGQFSAVAHGENAVNDDPKTVATFYTHDCLDSKPEIVRFSTVEGQAVLSIRTVPKADLRSV